MMFSRIFSFGSPLPLDINNGTFPENERKGFITMCQKLNESPKVNITCMKIQMTYIVHNNCNDVASKDF